MWESWDCYAEDGTLSADSMNHFAFGSVGEYLFRKVLGIDKLEAGFRKVLIKPDRQTGLRYVRRHFDSIWDSIKVDWKIIGKEASLTIVLSSNVSADIEFGNQRFKEVRLCFEIKVRLST